MARITAEVFIRGNLRDLPCRQAGLREMNFD
jgi:hypothetical protein